MASNARVVADETSFCDCISETYVVNLAGELFQSDLISDASYQAAIAEDSVLSPAHKVAHLVFEVVNKVGASPSNYKFIFRPGSQTLGRPGKPHATNVTHNSLVLSWEKPQYGADSVQSYTITYHTKDDPPGRWITRIATQQEHAELTNLAAKTTYLFKVRAESASGASGPYSETSDPIETSCQLADEIVTHCKLLSADGVKVYLLPTCETMRKNSIVKINVGQSQNGSAASHKVFMLVGATGAGKTSLVNAIANHIMGVDWEDEYRFKLISEETAEDYRKSQTKCITAYTFQASSLPYTLTVIDTPGFGDSDGLERDRQIVTQIKEFFSTQGDEGIDQLHGIGFVTPASQPRLTPTQRYVFDSILSVFGKDVADNIFLMLTFADGRQPPVLDAVRAAGVSFNSHFKFNNSALFANDQTDEFGKLFWKMGKVVFEKFFNQFSKSHPISLQLTREVLQEREQLEMTMQVLRPQITQGLAKMDELRQERQILEKHEADINSYKDFTYQVDVNRVREVQLPAGVYCAVCPRCCYNCHYNCNDDGRELYHCAAMNNSGSRYATCSECPGRCSWRDHVFASFKYELRRERETRTYSGLKARYESAMSERNQVVAMVTKLEEEIKKINMAVLEKIEKARQCLNRLKQIALKPNYLTEVEYIDSLIESEKREGRSGWMERVKALEEVRMQAEILSGKNPMVGHL